ncbi:HU family DNA-binding protein [Aestuariivivens sediminis]|uniref:HU family DNA-binding protein n=1 Tax=Aestuariivivens sediminis TaxID=2913557 RepID=UPI001F5AD215|nr:HU family DNA-binding protein [Aestuariivivens sediminis]
MAIPFRAIYKTVKLVTGYKKRWYASGFSRGRCDIHRLTQSIGQMSTMSPADVHGVIYALIDATITELKAGKIVEIGDFGTLKIKIRSKGVESQAEVNRKIIKTSEILFTPGRPMRQMLAELDYEKH